MVYFIFFIFKKKLKNKKVAIGWFLLSKLNPNNNWIKKIGQEGQTWEILYIHTMYWSFTTMSTCKKKNHILFICKNKKWVMGILVLQILASQFM